MSQITVVIIDEFEDEELTQEASAQLDLDSGMIFNILRNKNAHNKPWKTKDYTFTSGLLKIGSKELEFAVNVNKQEEYHVSIEELAEIKQKMSNLIQTKSKRMRM